MYFLLTARLTSKGDGVSRLTSRFELLDRYEAILQLIIHRTLLSLLSLGSLARRPADTRREECAAIDHE